MHYKSFFPCVELPLFWRGVGSKHLLNSSMGILLDAKWLDPKLSVSFTVGALFGIFHPLGLNWPDHCLLCLEFSRTTLAESVKGL